MLEEMVASVMKKTLAQDFPHLKLPAAVTALSAWTADCHRLGSILRVG